VSGLELTLLQIVVIVAASRVVGRAVGALGQPHVIGEIAAGILLGPSALGLFAPELFARLFPPASIPFLQSLSQIGLILFMFLVGLEFAPELMRGKGHTVVVISHASIVVPFLLGTALAIYLYPRVSDDSVSFRSFALFVGISMSITAFPVLARILAERGLTRTRIGNTVIACAAVDDVTAWCALAFVVIVARAGTLTDLAVDIALVAVYVVVMLRVVRPLLPRLLPRGEGATVAALLLALVSACTTEVLGIHALFGAFLAGTIIPRERALTETLIGQVKGLTTAMFLPLFFAVTGLRTNVGLLGRAELWICCALVLAVAIIGKFGGATVSAMAAGVPLRDAAAIGVLMNTRGLMEMVVLNIGLDIGVVSRGLFTMSIIMALVTTAMTAPLLDVFVRADDRESIDYVSAA